MPISSVKLDQTAAQFEAELVRADFLRGKPKFPTSNLRWWERIYRDCDGRRIIEKLAVNDISALRIKRIAKGAERIVELITFKP